MAKGLMSQREEVRAEAKGELCFTGAKSWGGFLSAGWESRAAGEQTPAWPACRPGHEHHCPLLGGITALHLFRPLHAGMGDLLVQRAWWPVSSSSKVLEEMCSGAICLRQEAASL